MISLQSQVRIILWKEYREQCDVRTLTFSLGLPACFPILSFTFMSLFMTRTGTASGVELMRTAIFTYFAFASFLLPSTIFMTSTFYRERQTKTLETLLATPLSPVGIWIGKTLFVFLVGYFFTNFVTWTSVVLINILRPFSVGLFLPSVEAAVIFFTVLPIGGFSVSALMGFAYLKTGRFAISNLIGLVLAALFYLFPLVTGGLSTLGWSGVGLLGLGSLLLLGVVWVAGKHLDSESLVIASN